VHELEHIKRRDWATQLFARAVCAFYWFHPLVWVANHQLALEAEHACDDAVVVRDDQTSYADQLVNLARRLATRPEVAVLGMAQRSDLGARVRAVLDEAQPRGRAGRRRTLAIATAGVAAVAAIAPLQLSASRVSASMPTSESLQSAPVRDSNSPRNAGRAIRVDAGSPVPAADSPREEPSSPREDLSSPHELQQQPRSSRLDRTLIEAVEDGELDDIRELMDAGANVNAAVPGDGSPLIVAAREGHTDIVRLLLERGADVNLSVPGDGAPLSMAAREGHLDIVQLLLDRGADVDQMTPGDENALIQASSEGHLAMVKLLVARGANVNARIWVDNTRRGGEWRSPLAMATRGGHEEIVAFLRGAGAVE
jgi:hypothetical protein